TRLDRPRDREVAWKRLSTDFADHPLTRRMALDLASAAFKQKSWKTAASYATLAVKSDDDAVKSEAWLMVGESELKQKRLAGAAAPRPLEPPPPDLARLIPFAEAPSEKPALAIDLPLPQPAVQMPAFPPATPLAPADKPTAFVPSPRALPCVGSWLGIARE